MAVPPTSLAPRGSAAARAVLRRTVRAARAAYVAALERALADRVAPLLDGRACVAGYAALPGEIDPHRIAFTAWPRVVGDDTPLTFHAAARGDLVPGYRGILEPVAGAPAATPDTVLVPLLAADARGNRLGYGAGHYDRTLPARPALRIGVAWDVQVVDALPAEPWDAPLDWLVTPTRTIDCHAAAGPVGAARGEG